MIEYEDLIFNNSQFLDLCRGSLNCNSFLFESDDNLFLNNFSFCFAKFIFCKGQNKPCNVCIPCQKVKLLSYPDLKVYPLGETVLVSDIKDLIEKIYLTPIESDYKVFIFKDFSTANIQSQNKLLKILEDPPKNCYIILNVTNINKILPTIISRCKKIRLNPIKRQALENCLKDSPGENFCAVLDQSQGNLTRAVNFLSNEVFLNNFENCIDTLISLKDSRYMIKYSAKLTKKKENALMILEIFETIFRDLLMIRLQQKKLVINQSVLKKLIEISNYFDSDAIDLILKKIYKIKKQLSFNCNFVVCIDSLLLYILEVKYLCQKSV